MADGSYCFTVNVVERRGNDLWVRGIAELREAALTHKVIETRYRGLVSPV